MTKVTAVECDNDPLVPVMVSGYVPVLVFLLVLMVSVELPDPVTDEGLKL